MTHIMLLWAELVGSGGSLVGPTWGCAGVPEIERCEEGGVGNSGRQRRSVWGSGRGDNGRGGSAVHLKSREAGLSRVGPSVDIVCVC